MNATIVPLRRYMKAPKADTAAKPHVLMVGGVAMNARVWPKLLPGFDTHMECHYVSLPGQDGQPVYPYVADWFMASEVERIADGYADLMKKKEVGRFHVIGISAGASVAQVLAARYPQHVERLVLISPVYGASGNLWTNVMAAVHSALTPQIGLCNPTFILREGRRFAELQRVMHAGITGFWKMRFQANIAACAPNYRAAIEQPTLMVCGDCDPGMSGEQRNRMAEEFANATLHVVPEAGHFPTYEHLASGKVVLDFLRPPLGLEHERLA